MSIGQDLLNVPMGEMIRSMAFAIAEAQLRLDHASIESAEMMGGLKTIVNDQGVTTFEDSRVFFGHEYMTIPEAIVTQGGPLNPAVNALISNMTFAYRTQTSATPYKETDASTYTDHPPVAVSAASLADYVQYAQTTASNIAAKREALALEQAKETPSSITLTSLKASIDGYLALDAHNRAAVKGVMDTRIRVPTRISLLELGFAPVFYSFIDTIIEVKISISITQENSSTTETTDTGRSVQASTAFRGIPFLRGALTRQRNVSTSQVNASYSSRYSYSAEGSSLLRTKLAPVPTPPILDERIHAIMEADQARQAAELAAIKAPPAPG
jgi:hypothetical protein